jgi:lipoprotein-anchoring transpeptidase ErfK/SrfK
VNKRLLWIGAAVVLIVVFVLSFKIFRSVKRIPRQQESEITSELLRQAKELETNLDLLAAKSIYGKLLSDFPDSPQTPHWQKKIENINIKILFSPIITEGAVQYEIKPGDTLYKIADQFNTTVELIKKSNNLKSDKIFPGKKIRVNNRPFSILVDKSQNILILKSEEDIIKSYVISTGLHSCTPVGNFKIKDRLINPPWYTEGKVIPPESPENILGTRWLGFDLAGYGIHGTNDPDSLGKSITQGCVRMSNQDVEEIFTIVPTGTEVIIVD